MYLTWTLEADVTVPLELTVVLAKACSLVGLSATPLGAMLMNRSV
jgi:hypothetical protein